MGRIFSHFSAFLSETADQEEEEVEVVLQEREKERT
jgi:hypothetical protein